MVFRFLILSDEVDDFKREIQIDADASFFDLHKAIIHCVDYNEGEMASFFLCDDNWEKETEITLIEMDTSSEEDSYIMGDCVLNDFLEDEKQKLLYVFDYFTERSFFIELAEIITGKDLNAPKCTKSSGEPPKQFIEFENLDLGNTDMETGENFYGDESYDMDELDSEGFDGLDNPEPDAAGDEF